MSLKDWQENGWLKPHKTDIQEITSLMATVKRDLHDATTQGLSLDWQFGITYNAHEALDDSRTCGKIVAIAAEKNSVSSVQALLKKCGASLYNLAQ